MNVKKQNKIILALRVFFLTIMIVGIGFCGGALTASLTDKVSTPTQEVKVAQTETESSKKSESVAATATPRQEDVAANSAEDSVVVQSETDTVAVEDVKETVESGNEAGAGNEDETEVEALATIATATTSGTIPTEAATTPVVSASSTATNTPAAAATTVAATSATATAPTVVSTPAELRAEALTEAKVIAEMSIPGVDNEFVTARLNIIDAMASVCKGTSWSHLECLMYNVRDFVPVEYLSGTTRDEIINNFVASGSFVEAASADANTLFAGDLIFLENSDVVLMSLGQLGDGSNLFVRYHSAEYGCTVLFGTDDASEPVMIPSSKGGDYKEYISDLVDSGASAASIVAELNGGTSAYAGQDDLTGATVLRPKNNPCVEYDAVEILQELYPKAAKAAAEYLRR